MRNDELIKQLQQYPADAEVSINTDYIEDSNYDKDISAVHITSSSCGWKLCIASFSAEIEKE